MINWKVRFETPALTSFAGRNPFVLSLVGSSAGVASEIPCQPDRKIFPFAWADPLTFDFCLEKCVGIFWPRAGVFAFHSIQAAARKAHEGQGKKGHHWGP